IWAFVSPGPLPLALEPLEPWPGPARAAKKLGRGSTAEAPAGGRPAAGLPGKAQLKFIESDHFETQGTQTQIRIRLLKNDCAWPFGIGIGVGIGIDVSHRFQ
nr:hypothetical protein [Desulfobacterales bacterium]